MYIYLQKSANKEYMLITRKCGRKDKIASAVFDCSYTLVSPNAPGDWFWKSLSKMVLAFTNLKTHRFAVRECFSGTNRVGWLRQSTIRIF